MKILAINGSHRGKRGNTHKLLMKLFEGSTEAGAECEEIALSELKINPCIDCKVCNTEKSWLKCIYEEKDDVRMVFNKMKDADIVIISSPVYLFTLSGKLKIFLDRINSTANSEEFLLNPNGLFFHHIDEEMCSKKYVFLITCDNFMNETVKNSVSYFKTYMKFMNGENYGILIRKNCKFIFKNGKSADEKKCKEAFEAFYEAGKALVNEKKIPGKILRRTNQNVMKIPLPVLIMAKIPLFNKKLNEEMKKRNIL